MNDIIEKYITESSEIIKNSLSVTNDIEKVSSSASIFSALFTPQGKYLFEFYEKLLS